MGTDDTGRVAEEQTEFERCVAALLAGDAAFVFTFVERCGTIVASMLEDRGVARAELPRLIEETALALLGSGPDERPAVEIVSALAAEIASEPEAGALGRAGTCGADAPRSLHLVDIENLAGDPRVCDTWFVTTVRAYLGVAGLGETDLVLMAANPHLWRRTAWHVPTAFAYQPAPGADGADINLLTRAPAGWVSRRFDRVVIGSGDGIFTPLARQLRESGVTVEVISQPARLAHTLRQVAHAVRYLPPRQEPPAIQGEAA